MRILHIITSLNIGGAEKLMVDLLPRLKEKGVDVEILLLVGKKTMFYEQLEKNGVKIHTFSEQGNVYNPKHLFILYRFLKKNKFDIIHTHNTAPQIFAAIASILLPLKLVTTEHSTDNRRRDLRWYKIIDKWMYDRYSRVISISDAAHNNLISYLGIKNTTRKFSVVYNGVDVDKYANAVGTHANDSQKKIVTMVAGFRYQKDQDTLIKACSLLPKEDYELWLVGDGERRKELVALVNKLVLQANVKFWGNRNDIPEILKSSDVNVMSSHIEGFGLSAVEGMAAGKPFIASNVEGLCDIVEGAGKLFEHGDHVQLANLITELLEHPVLYDKVASQCFSKSRQYDISKMVDGYMSVYQNLLT